MLLDAIIADRSVAAMADFVVGANRKGFHLAGVNWGRDLPEPDAPGPGEVTLRVKAVALNHIDVWGWRGMAFAKRKMPLVIGAEASGVVEAIGPGVGNILPGQLAVAVGIRALEAVGGGDGPFLEAEQVVAIRIEFAERRDARHQRLVAADQVVAVAVEPVEAFFLARVLVHFGQGRADQALLFHPLDQRCRTVVADAEAALDGLDVIRTSLDAKRMDAPSCVRSYKALSNVERAFRSLKTVDLKVRPIHHRLADRVRAHILLCMLAFYVEWHMREAWRELMFADTDQAAKATRDPVAPARRSASASAKAATKVIDDEQPAHSFATLMAEMATLVRNTCRTPNSASDAPTFQITTTQNEKQKQKFICPISWKCN